MNMMELWHAYGIIQKVMNEINFILIEKLINGLMIKLKKLYQKFQEEILLKHWTIILIQILKLLFQ